MKVVINTEIERATYANLTEEQEWVFRYRVIQDICEKLKKFSQRDISYFKVTVFYYTNKTVRKKTIRKKHEKKL